MRKLNLRYLWTAGAGALIAAAAIALPAWAAGGGDSSAQTRTQAQGAQLSSPPGGAGFSLRGNAPSAAEIKQSRAKADEFASCLKDHGIDVPAPGSSSRPPQPPSSSELKQITKDCGTPPAPPAGMLPPPGAKQAQQSGKPGAKGECPPPPLPPAPNSGSKSGS
jgi:hypothetical protein